MVVFYFLVAGLAVWRISHAVVKESGPLMVFARLRAYFAGKQKRSGGLFDAVSCVACLSFYIGLVAALWFAQNVFELFGYGLAFSAFSVLTEALMTPKSKNSNSLPLVASPARNDEIRVTRSSTPKKGNNVVSHPHPINLPPTVVT